VIFRPKKKGVSGGFDKVNVKDKDQALAWGRKQLEIMRLNPDDYVIEIRKEGK
jgi:hypothetical protein